jgi:hypothetical protein
MANLEYVIRPYQSPNPFGQTIIPSTSTRASRATLTWGATVSGTMPQAHAKAAAPGTTYQFECCSDKLDELNRSNNRIRIVGNDGESYVDVERPYQMKLKKNSKQECGDSSAQISYVTQGINAVLNDFTDAITEATSKFGTDSDCSASWGFAI